MHDAPAILAIKLAPLLDIMKEREINHDAFLDSVEIDPALFYSHHKKLTVNQAFRLLKTAVEVTGDDDIGLYNWRKTDVFAEYRVLYHDELYYPWRRNEEIFPL